MIDEATPIIQSDELPPAVEKQVMTAKRAMAIVGVFFLVQVVLGFFLGLFSNLYFSMFSGVENKSDAISSLILPISILSVIPAGLIALWMTFTTLQGPAGQNGLDSIGWRKSNASSIIAAALTGIFISIFYLFILIPANPPEVGQQWGPVTSAVLSGGYQHILWAIFALALAPPIEEFIFRGVLLNGLTNAIGIRLAALVVTGAFVLLHITEAIYYWPAWIGLSLMACTTVIIRIKTGSLLPAIATHASYNLVIVLISFAATNMQGT